MVVALNAVGPRKLQGCMQFRRSCGSLSCPAVVAVSTNRRYFVRRPGAMYVQRRLHVQSTGAGRAARLSHVHPTHRRPKGLAHMYVRPHANTMRTPSLYARRLHHLACWQVYFFVCIIKLGRRYRPVITSHRLCLDVWIQQNY